MIDKVIIAEDQESVNLSIQRIIEELNIPGPEYAYYCDDALNKIKLAAQKGAPYDLLITDLSFEPDGKPQKIPDGFSLIRAVREVQPAITILVFTGEQRPNIIDG